MRLVIQKPLSLKEVLSPLKGTLLLHLLERILIALQNITRSVAGETVVGILIVVV